MFTKHIEEQLTAYIHDELPAERRQQAEAHLAVCPECSREHRQILHGVELLAQLPIAQAPPEIWVKIQQSLDAAGERRSMWRLAVALAVLVLVVSSGVYWRYFHRTRIQIGTIGTVDVEPGTRIRVVSAGAGEYRLALESGQIHAKIFAPPRMFFVETAAGTAIDMGCEYTLRCDRAGAGLLVVTAGWVSYEWQGRESLVPAGAVCHTRPRLGPGTPYFADAPPTLVRALQGFDFENAGPAELNVILTDSRGRDTLTLWHLLSRVDAIDRPRVYDRMAAFSPPPPGVSREQILRLDAGALSRWRAELAWTW